MATPKSANYHDVIRLMDKEELQQHCVQKVAEYEYIVPESAIGLPLPAEKVEALLKEFKAAIVEPYLETIELRDTMEQMEAETPILCRVWVVADDRDGYKVIYNPNTKEFGLAQYKIDDESDIPSSINVNGDFVGTFMAR